MKPPGGVNTIPLYELDCVVNPIERTANIDKITNLMITRWLKDDKTLEAIIKIETLKLEELNGKKKKGSTFEEDIAVIEKHRSIGLNPKKTSVKMFYTYINLMRKDG